MTPWPVIELLEWWGLPLESCHFLTKLENLPGLYCNVGKGVCYMYIAGSSGKVWKHVVRHVWYARGFTVFTICL